MNPMNSQWSVELSTNNAHIDLSMGNSQWTRVFISSQWKLSIGQPLSSQWTSLNRINSQWTISKAKLYNPKKFTEIFSKRQIYVMLRTYNRIRVSVLLHYTRSELCEAAAAAQPLHTPRPRGPTTHPTHSQRGWTTHPLHAQVAGGCPPLSTTFSDLEE